jgi:hypothetical protein
MTCPPVDPRLKTMFGTSDPAREAIRTVHSLRRQLADRGSRLERADARTKGWRQAAKIAEGTRENWRVLANRWRLEARVWRAVAFVTILVSAGLLFARVGCAASP